MQISEIFAESWNPIFSNLQKKQLTKEHYSSE